MLRLAEDSPTILYNGYVSSVTDFDRFKNAPFTNTLGWSMWRESVLSGFSTLYLLVEQSDDSAYRIVACLTNEHTAKNGDWYDWVPEYGWKRRRNPPQVSIENPVGDPYKKLYVLTFPKGVLNDPHMLLAHSIEVSGATWTWGKNGSWVVGFTPTELERAIKDLEQTLVFAKDFSPDYDDMVPVIEESLAKLRNAVMTAPIGAAENPMEAHDYDSFGDALLQAHKQGFQYYIQITPHEYYIFGDTKSKIGQVYFKSMMFYAAGRWHIAKSDGYFVYDLPNGVQVIGSHANPRRGTYYRRKYYFDDIRALLMQQYRFTRSEADRSFRMYRDDIHDYYSHNVPASKAAAVINQFFPG